MKIGVYKFRRRYSAAQVIVDIVSAGALILQVFVITAHIEWMNYLDRMNRTDKVLYNEWYPLLIWAVLAVLVFGFSFFLILKKKKEPVRYNISKNNVVKYCNIIDTCISCVRLMILIILFDISSTHSYLILFEEFQFPSISLVSVLIIIAVLVLTKFRLEAISDVEQERQEREEKKKTIIED